MLQHKAWVVAGVAALVVVTTTTAADARKKRSRRVKTEPAPATCHLPGAWSKTYDFAVDGKLKGKKTTNTFSLTGHKQSAEGRYTGKEKTNSSVFAASCQPGKTPLVVVEQNDGSYHAVYVAQLRDGVWKGTWFDSSGNRGDVEMKTTPRPASTDDGLRDDVPEGAVAPPPAMGAAPGALGATCLSAKDCNSGMCEGMGCGTGQPGVCVEAQRICTKDLKRFCGCDGTSFRGSSSCPGRRYAHEGRCSRRESTPAPGGY